MSTTAAADFGCFTGSPLVRLYNRRGCGLRFPARGAPMICRITAGIFLMAVTLHAEAVRIEIKSHADLLPGKTFGSAGAYEKLSGRIYFAVDPKNSANGIVTDIDK